MNITPSFASLNRHLTHMEKALNIIGYIPFIGIGSGIVRIVGGELQVITALALSAIFAVKAFFSNQLNDWQCAERCLSYVIHGVGNIIRGSVEIIPLWGTIVCILYDLSRRRTLYKGELPPLQPAL